MPKRSNDFQRLIKLIEKQLTEENVTVVESKLIEDSVTGQKREVDILIETEINDHKIAIAIECRDHERKAGVEWLEQLMGKYSSLPIDKIIAVSKSGFYETAFVKSKNSNIKLLSLEEALEEDWVRTIHKIDSILIKLIRFRPNNLAFESEGGLFEQDLFKIMVYDNQNNLLGNLGDYYFSLLNNPTISNRFQDMLVSTYDVKRRSFKGGSELANIKWNLEQGLLIDDDYGFSAVLKSVEYQFKCEVNETSVPTTKFTYNNKQVATITKEFENMKLIMSVSESEAKEPTLAVMIEFKNRNGEKIEHEIITTPLPTYDGPIEFTSFTIG